MIRACAVLSRREVHTLAGTGKPGFQDGASTTAKFSFPTGILWNNRKKTLLVADSDNHSIREIRICTFLRTSSNLGVKGLAGAAGVCFETSSCLFFEMWMIFVQVLVVFPPFSLSFGNCSVRRYPVRF